MTRQSRIQIEIKKHGENFAIHADDQLVAVAVYRKGAVTLAALLQGLIYYTSRKLFRQALEEALVAKEADVEQKPAKNPAPKESPAKPAKEAKAPKGKAAKSKPAKAKAAKEPAATPAEPPTGETPAEAPVESAS